MQTQTPSNRLAEIRKARGLERYDISARFRVDPTTVYRWERGESTIPDEKKPELAEFLGVSVAYLMGWDDAEQTGAAA
jgi:transcriptional regulator with XRE-family HTH domain